MTPQEERDAKIKLIEVEGKRRAGEGQWQAEMTAIKKLGGFSLEQIDAILQTPDSAVDVIRHVGAEALLRREEAGDKDAAEAYAKRRAAERKAWREMKGR
jgi:hypothetical protein